jgi:hypothetical protein
MLEFWPSFRVEHGLVRHFAIDKRDSDSVFNQDRPQIAIFHC